MNVSTKIAGIAAGLLVTMLLFNGASLAQSGRGVMKGYVAFEGVAYVEKQPRARVELRETTAGSRNVYTTETGEHGSYNFESVAMGEYTLRISAPGFTTYEANLYIPSDFVCSLAVMLKVKGGKETGNRKN